jgi:dihydroorotate dehydrogenase
MDLTRRLFDGFYDSVKGLVFYFTKKDPEKAHGLFSKTCQALYSSKLHKIVLDCKENYSVQEFGVSNAAGFNKNAEIPLQALKYLGFDRVVVGTVTGEPWKGNEKPRVWRYAKTSSIVNFIGWDNKGAETIAQTLENYEYALPLTISIGAIPNPEFNLKQRLRDIEKTIITFRNIKGVDRFEYDASCPNLPLQENNSEFLKEFLNVISQNILPHQSVFIKVSPDISKREVKENIRLAKEYSSVKGFVVSNTTTNHDPFFIPKSPGRGGASGDAVYEKSLEIQEIFFNNLRESNLEIIACGGINSIKRAKERGRYGAKEIQILTPLIFTGTKLLRELKG